MAGRVVRFRGGPLAMLLGLLVLVAFLVLAVLFLVVAAGVLVAVLGLGLVYVAAKAPLPLAKHAGRSLLLGGVVVLGVGLWLPHTWVTAGGGLAMLAGVLPWVRGAMRPEPDDDRHRDRDRGAQAPMGRAPWSRDAPEGIEGARVTIHDLPPDEADGPR